MATLKTSRAPARLSTRLMKNINSVDLPGGGGIMAYGEENNYPQMFENAINGSVTSISTARVLATAIGGGGFINEAINNAVIGRNAGGGDFTVKNLLHVLSKQTAYFQGFYTHINRNADGLITEINPLIFSKCRLSKPDDMGYCSKIAVSRDFENVRKNKPVFYEIYQRNNESFIKSIEDLESYKGQVFYKFFDDTYIYPLSTFDSVFLDMLTESEVSEYRFNESANNFMPRNIVMLPEPETEEDEKRLTEKINSLHGTDGDRTIVITAKVDESGKMDSKSAISVAKVGADIQDTLFESWEKIIGNRIRKAAYALPEILIQHDGSTLGTTSGEAITMAVSFYNSVTAPIRSEFYNAIIPILKNFNDKALIDNTDWSYKDFKL